MGQLSKEAAELRDYFRSVADEIEKHHTNVTSAQMVGNGLAAYGGGVSLLGLAFAPATAGASLFLAGVGGVFLAVGGATSGGADVARTRIENSASKEIDEKWNAFRMKVIGVIDLEEMSDSELLRLFKEMFKAGKVVVGTVKTLRAAYHNLRSAARTEYVLGRIGANAASRLASKTNVVGLLYSIYEFGKICAEVSSGKKSEMAAYVRNLANELDKIAKMDI